MLTGPVGSSQKVDLTFEIIKSTLSLFETIEILSIITFADNNAIQRVYLLPEDNGKKSVT